jgi:hypothetical protein
LPARIIPLILAAIGLITGLGVIRSALIRSALIRSALIRSALIRSTLIRSTLVLAAGAAKTRTGPRTGPRTTTGPASARRLNARSNQPQRQTTRHERRTSINHDFSLCSETQRPRIWPAKIAIHLVTFFISDPPPNLVGIERIFAAMFESPNHFDVNSSSTFE